MIQPIVGLLDRWGRVVGLRRGYELPLGVKNEVRFQECPLTRRNGDRSFGCLPVRRQRQLTRTGGDDLARPITNSVAKRCGRRLGSHAPDQGNKSSAAGALTVLGHQDATAVQRAGGLDADLFQFQATGILAAVGIKVDAADPKRAMPLAVVLAAVPFPTLSGRGGDDNLAGFATVELADHLLERHEMRGDLHSHGVTRGGAADANANLARVAEQGRVARADADRLGSPREIEIEAAAAKLRTAGMSAGTKVPLLVGRETGREIVRSDGRGVIAGRAGQQPQLVEQQGAARFAVILNLQPNRLGWAVDRPVVVPAPMARPSRQRHEHVDPTVVRCPKTLLKSLPGLVRVAQCEAVSRRFLQPESQSRQIRRSIRLQSGSDIVATAREIERQPSAIPALMGGLRGTFKAAFRTGKLRSARKHPAFGPPSGVEVFVSREVAAYRGQAE